MSMSAIELLYEQTINGGDWIDISRHALIANANFTSASNANPGTCEVTLRDPDRRLLDLVTGHRLRLFVDGQPLWSGHIFVRGRGNFLPAGDGKTQTRARKWTLQGGDNNTLFDRRIIRYNDPVSGYLRHIRPITVDRMDGWIIKHGLANYTDIPTADPWLDIESQIDDVRVPWSYLGPTDTVGHLTTAHPWDYPEQGAKVREMFTDASVISSGVFYIGPDDAVHYHAFQTRECPWGFSDRPNDIPLMSDADWHDISPSTNFQGRYVGFRELDNSEDGSQLGTDALIWGGSEFAGPGQTVFHRATDHRLEGIHGKWQWPEKHFDEDYFKLQAGVTQRAHMVVYGQPGTTETGHDDPTGGDAAAGPGTVVGEGPRGMRFPNWSYTFSWHSIDVPRQGGVQRHIYPGDIVPIQLWTFSEDGGATPFLKYLPLRSLQISFPTGAADGRALVRFTGTFDLTNNDPKFLWKWLRAREKTIKTQIVATATDGSAHTPIGAYGTFTPSPNPPDGASTVYTIPFGYIDNTTVVLKNGLQQIAGINYLESDPEGGEITFTSVPKTTDRLLVRCRTLRG